jgi:hypothetical protein
MHEALHLSRKKHKKTTCPLVYFRVLRRSLFLEIANGLFFEGQSMNPAQFSARSQDFMEARRNIPSCNFVYTGAAPYRAAQGEIQKKPRGGSRGVMTRSFSGR